MLSCEIYVKFSHLNIKCFPTQYLQYFVALGAFYISIRNHASGAQVAFGGQHGPKIQLGLNLALILGGFWLFFVQILA